MNIRAVARRACAAAAVAALLLAAQGTAWAQHGGVHGGGFRGGSAGGGFRGGAVMRGVPAPHGFRGYWGRPGYAWRGDGWRGYRWRGPGWRGYGWGWRPGGGWWWGGWGWPLGVYLSVLPWYYSTIWWNGIPYYYANGDYYLWNGTASQYEQVQPPPEVAQQGAGAPRSSDATRGPEDLRGSDELYAYPMHDQSPETQASDKSQCRTWASGQTASTGPKEYLRAEAACLEARGYTVR